MAEGSFIVGAALTTYLPFVIHASAPDAVSFQVVDSTDGDSARGDYAGRLPGIVRPMLEWETTVEEQHAVAAS
jgi:lipopolysaccharide transport system ATP-binding protein